MTTTPPEAPPESRRDGPDDGPRVSRDEVRDLARLRRSRDDRKIAGVAGGLARHLDIDPLIPRVVLAVLVFFGGAGLLLYGVIWLVVPTEGTDDATVRLDDRSRSVALAVVGVIAVLALVGDSLGGWVFPWPLALAGVVLFVVLLFRGREPRVHPLLATQGTYVARTPAPTPRRGGPLLFPYAVAVIALGFGVLGILDTAGVDVAASAFPALALGTCAALLLLGAFWGRAGGLILLGLLAAGTTAGVTAASEIDAGQVDAAPRSAAAVAERYDLTFGEIRLDLTDVVDLADLDGRTVDVEVEVAGHIEVTVPDGVDLVIRSRVDLGERRILGDRLGDGDDTVRVDGGPDAPELVLDLRLAFGEIEVVREGSTR